MTLRKKWAFRTFNFFFDSNCFANKFLILNVGSLILQHGLPLRISESNIGLEFPFPDLSEFAVHI